MKDVIRTRMSFRDFRLVLEGWFVVQHEAGIHGAPGPCPCISTELARTLKNFTSFLLVNSLRN